MTLSDPQYKTLLDAQAIAKRLIADRYLRIKAMHASAAIDELLDKYAERQVIEGLAVAAPY